MSVHRLTKAQARRIAIRAQLLDARRPVNLLDVVSHLTFLQLDPTAAIAPSADLVAWTRLGGAYRPAQLTQALEQDRSLYEVRALVRPMADLGLHLAEMAAWPFADEERRHWSVPGPRAHRWLEENHVFRKDVLALLRRSGPLMSREVPDTSVVPWESTGWTGDRNVAQLLEFLNARGEVAIAGRVGRQRLWDLAERVYPPAAEVPLVEARRVLAGRRLRALGIARPDVLGVAGERYFEEVEGEPAEVEGTSGSWVVDPTAVGQEFEGRTALLSPFDRLVHDRVRARDLFDFEYTLEMYKPAHQRRWGYFALPVLHDDRLVGKVDAIADRKVSRLLVHAIHEDVRFTHAMTKAVHAELEELASWLGLGAVELETA
ncbi:MAG TPA: crosslink repair DNA glycosylase YcaQ family protein [Candidatus Dormibacteraeota bacterium]|nr:crosslink repair DNA glycosylase YcaQ family protein [Candidatus Dormibacteraeota bacterium]